MGELKRFVKHITYVPEDITSPRDKFVFRAFHIKGMVKGFAGFDIKPVDHFELQHFAEHMGINRLAVARMTNVDISKNMYFHQKVRTQWNKRRKAYGEERFRQFPELCEINNLMDTDSKMVLNLFADELLSRNEINRKKTIPKISPPAGPEKDKYDKIKKSAKTLVNNMYIVAKRKRKKRLAKQLKKDMKEPDETGRVMPDSYSWIEYDGEK